MTRKFSGDELVLATHNAGKLKEISAILGSCVKSFSTAADAGLESPAETGTTYLENATIKALYTAQKTGKPALADDSGMGVNALGGAPGVYSADWAELPDGTRNWDTAIARVMTEMGDAPDRGAAFVSCLVLAWPDGHTEHVMAEMPGTITWPPRGAGGFGYDPIFQPDGETRSFAEMTLEEKNAISHRGKSLRMMLAKCF